MQETVNFNSNQVVVVEDENVSAILLDIKALQNDGTTVCDIADLNKIAVSIKVFRKGQKEPKAICDGYLDDILSALSVGSTRYGIATTKQSNGYLVPIGFDGNIALSKGDKIEVRVKAQNTAFTSLNQSNSDITIETVPAVGRSSSVCTVVDQIPYRSQEQTIKKTLGNNVLKIVLAHDFSQNYKGSSEAKPVNGITLIADNYEKIASENLLVAENLSELQFNPGTEIKHLSLYSEPNLLQNATLQALYDKPVTSDAKILVLRRAVL
ncbi:MAG: hypothetical protein Wins2KO_04220 [Winogradskyella sp.]